MTWIGMAMEEKTWMNCEIMNDYGGVGGSGGSDGSGCSCLALMIAGIILISIF